MSAPAIIYLTLTVVGLICTASLHGEERKGPAMKYNFWVSLISATIAIGLLTLGGFFN